MLKKWISVLLVVLIAVSAIAITSISPSAATYNGVELESNKLYFDTDGSGWAPTGSGTDKISFYVYSIKTGEEQIAWGGKKLRGNLVEGSDTLWEYDPADKGMTLNSGEQYAIIFTCDAGQTYDLIFDTTCLGHVAKCDGTLYENPVDSLKKTLAAYWIDLDAHIYGPRLQITSIGNVVGTCIEAGKTSIDVFTEFISVPNYYIYNGKTGLENSRQYSPKTEQQMIDDIGKALWLTAEQVRMAFNETGVSTSWSYEASSLRSTPIGESTLGDVNVNNYIDISDATYIQKYLAYQKSLIGGDYQPASTESAEFLRADVDTDGRISIYDALRIRRYLAKMCKLDGSPYDD